MAEEQNEDVDTLKTTQAARRQSVSNSNPSSPQGRRTSYVEVDPQEVGVDLTKSELLIGDNDTCDYYEIKLRDKPMSRVYMTLRGLKRSLKVTPEQIEFSAENYDVSRVICVSGRGDTDKEKYPDEVNIVHHLFREQDTKTYVFRVKVYVLDKEGNYLYGWGRNQCSQLGFASQKKRGSTAQEAQCIVKLPVRIDAVSVKATASIITAAAQCSSALMDDGSIFTWGNDSYGQLGQGDAEIAIHSSISTMKPSLRESSRETSESAAPIVVSIPTSVACTHTLPMANIACGDEHTVMVTTTGAVFSCGRGLKGRLGLGDAADRSMPVLVSQLRDLFVVGVSCGAAHSMCLTKEGHVYAWGEGESGALGLFDTSDQLTPTRLQVEDGILIQKVACGRHHSALLSVLGEMYTMGWGDDGRLGHGDTFERLVPTKVRALKTRLKSIACGGHHSAALTEDMEVYTWGNGAFGQLGLGTKRFQHHRIPQHVTYFKGKGVRSVVCGAFHSCAITVQGFLYTWGSQEAAQLGVSSNDNQGLPIIVDHLLGKLVVQVAAGADHTLALCANTSHHYPSDGNKFSEWKANFLRFEDEERMRVDQEAKEKEYEALKIRHEKIEKRIQQETKFEEFKRQQSKQLHRSRLQSVKSRRTTSRPRTEPAFSSQSPLWPDTEDNSSKTAADPPEFNADTPSLFAYESSRQLDVDESSDNSGSRDNIEDLAQRSVASLHAESRISEAAEATQHTKRLVTVFPMARGSFTSVQERKEETRKNPMLVQARARRPYTSNAAPFPYHKVGAEDAQRTFRRAIVFGDI